MDNVKLPGRIALVLLVNHLLPCEVRNADDFRSRSHLGNCVYSAHMSLGHPAAIAVLADVPHDLCSITAV